MACSGLLLAATVSGSCNNLGGIGGTVWFGNIDDLSGYSLEANGTVSALTFKTGKRLWPVTTNELQNHYEVASEMVGGQVLFNHTVTVMGGAVRASTTGNDYKAWTDFAKAKNLFAICRNQTTDDTNIHFVILGLDNGLVSTSGDGFTSGTARMDLNNVTVVKAGVSAGGPIPFIADDEAPDGNAAIATDLAEIIGYETPAA
jgi:hypothetical protein